MSNRPVYEKICPDCGKRHWATGLIVYCDDCWSKFTSPEDLEQDEYHE